MFRNFSHGLSAARIASLLLAAVFIVSVAAPLKATGVTNVSMKSRRSAELQFSAALAAESPSDETFRVQTWIPGFDDVEPAFACLVIPAPSLSEKKISSHARFGKLTGVDGCGLILRKLPWNFSSDPTGRVDFFVPIM